MAPITDRMSYQAIVDRPRLRLPNDARLAVWVIVNVEEWSIERAQPRQVLPAPMGQPLQPDAPNWSWHEYGNRVGFWRVLEALKARDIKTTMAINGNVCNSYPRIAGAAKEAGWEFMGHGHVQRPMHHLEDQRRAIFDAVETIEKFSGTRPRGWESPGLTETEDTLDLLAEAGIDHVANWPVDDLPVEMASRHGPVLAIPYTVETNDIVVHAIQHMPSDAFKVRCMAQFDRLYREGADNARVMVISVHPYLTGVPHRIDQFEALLDYVLSHQDVAMMTGAEITDWYRAAAKA